MSVLEEINSIVGREVTFKEVTYKGSKGFLPEYINFNFQQHISEVFAPTQEESANKFLSYLKTIKQPSGDEDAQTRVTS